MSEQSPILSQRLLDAQAGVLGSMLIDPDTVPLVLSRLRPEDFSARDYRAVYETIQRRFQAGEAITPILVRESLGGGPDSPWTALLTGVMDATTTAAHVDAYVDQLRQDATLARIRDLGAQAAEADTLEEAEALVDRMQAQRVSRPTVAAMDMAEGFDRFLDRHDGERKPDYLTWGVEVLDERIFAEPGDMVVLGGYPSDGKTALALQFAVGIARGKRVGFFSYESTRDKLYDRIVAREALLSYTAIKRNTLTEEDYRELLELRGKLTGPSLTLIDAAGMTVADIQAYSQAHRYEVVVIDYLQKVASPKGSRMTDFERVSAISSGLQQFGRRSEITVLALSQLSRPGRESTSQASRKDRSEDQEDRPHKVRPPTLSDLRSSGQIEQDADVVLFLYREYTNDKLSDRVLRIAKNKEGEALDKIRLRFDGDHQEFSRIAPEAPKETKEKPKERKKPHQPLQETFWADGGGFESTPWGQGGGT